MCNLTRFRSLISLATVGLYISLTTGCGVQTPHPNQLSSFDGASYDSLLLAHGALTSLRLQVAMSYPKYSPIFNQANVSYAAAYNAYVAFRAAPKDQASVAVAISNLTISIVALENTFQTDLHPSSATVTEVHRKARNLREKAIRQQITVSDILTELEIAAAVARAIPAASAYAGVASMVIAATSQALAEETAETGQPIDLNKIVPVPLI